MLSNNGETFLVQFQQQMNHLNQKINGKDYLLFFFRDSDNLTAGSCVNPDKITCWKDLICFDMALFNSILECPNILVHQS